MKMKTFLVRGFCFVPIECHLRVKAHDKDSARQKATNKAWSKADYSDRRFNYNSIDTAAAFDWEPLEDIEEE